MSAAILSIHNAFVTFGRKALFEDLSFNIHEGKKICLVGKNGAGKTTLLHMIAGTRELDSGTRWQQPGINIGYLKQDVVVNKEQTVIDFIISGLPKGDDADENRYMAYIMLEPLELKENDKMGQLSGGQLRRAALAQTLIAQPDILLLDEPTNHLDLEAIKWLEDYLRAYKGTLLCISHDKRFLANITNQVFWLDRSNIRVCPKGFGHFDEWSQMLIDQEARELSKREKLVEQELAWARQGVKARRKRNVRRLEEMEKARAKLKEDKSSFRKAISKIELEPLKGTQASKIIAEFYKVKKSFFHEGQERKILDNFNFRIVKGDRIGILGKNGSGKTTFLKLLIGALSPDAGKIKLANNIELSYFDQKREDLNPEDSLWKTLCPDGGDHVNVAGNMRHVCGYLKDFLFDPKHARDLVQTLSGGQRNRLMLAKVLASPGNFLILDEPTNDLDMETMEMLEDILANYDGTLFIVSHDRDFLDQTVTQIISFEGDADVKSYIGGYSDYLKEVSESGAAAQSSSKSKKNNFGKDGKVGGENKKGRKKNEKKLFSYKLKDELNKLPAKIKQMENELSILNEKMSDPNLYNDNPKEFDEISRKIVTLEQQLEQSEMRWLELEEMKEES